MLIHERSGGIPRTISVMCDNALLTACGLGKNRVDSRMVLEVARDFDFGETRAYEPGVPLGHDSEAPLQSEAIATVSPEDVQGRTAIAEVVQADALSESAIGKNGDHVLDDTRQVFEPAKSHRFSLFGRR
jgi:hypothetical protein